MRAIINGVEGGSFTLRRGQDAAWHMFLMNDDGSVLNVTGDTVTLEIYDRADRKNAATVSNAVTLTTAASGYCTITISDTNSALLTAGQTYYAFVKRSQSGPLISFAAKPCLILSA